MNIVSRFEANLLRILHFFLGQAPAQQALPLVQNRCSAPPCLSRTAVQLVEDSLAKGCPLMLARAGGWRKERFVRGERVVGGRLWERTPPPELGLTFSRHALDFLIWMTAEDPRDKESTWRPPLAELTPADWLLFFFAHRALRDDADLAGVFRDQVAFARNPLCRLAYPEHFYSGGADPVPDYRPWTNGIGACILEALQPLLERRWVQLESGKGRMTDWRALRTLGMAQEEVLDGFLDAVEQAGRLDLAGFLLAASARLLTPRATPHMWVGETVRTGPPRMADRVEMQRAALALVRQMDRFHDWEQRARSVGYLDEGYEASQLTKDTWERHGGDALHSRAQAISRELDPLRVSAEGQS